MEMDKLQREQGAKYLRNFADDIEGGKVQWYAITVMYHNYRIAIHSKGAPARPAGI